MPLPGRIEGRISEDGQSYEVWQGKTLMKSTPIDEARSCKRHARAIRQNKWEPVRDYLAMRPRVDDEEGEP